MKSSLPKEHSDEQANRFRSGQGGGLQPLMCVDKTLDELGKFSDLVAESETIEPNWHMVLVAGLSGRNGVPPSSAEAEQSLKMMAQTVESGGDLSGYMAFDKSGSPIQFAN